MPAHDRHEQAVAVAFDGQAAAFERAPIQTDPRLLDGLVAAGRLPEGEPVLDAGCGPGLVAEAVLRAPGGHAVHGVDLSAEMVRRAQERCAPFGGRATFARASAPTVADDVASGSRPPFGAAVTRFVLHHVTDPEGFVAAMAAAVRPGGVVVVADHVADADPALAEWHRRVEVMRDRSHVTNLTPGTLVDLAAAAGLTGLTYEERAIATDFDEWFARGTPSATREECRAEMLRPEGRASRAWNVAPMDDGNLWISGHVGIVRGEVPA